MEVFVYGYHVVSMDKKGQSHLQHQASFDELLDTIVFRVRSWAMITENFSI